MPTIRDVQLQRQEKKVYCFRTTKALDRLRFRVEIDGAQGIIDNNPQSVSSVSIDTPAGTAPILPEKGTVTYSNGMSLQESVLWEPVEPSQYSVKGQLFLKQE